MLSFCCKGIAVLGAGISIFIDIGTGNDISTVTTNSIKAVARQPEAFKEIRVALEKGILYVLIPFLLAFILAIAIILAPKIRCYVSRWLSLVMTALSAGIATLASIGASEGTGDDALDEALEIAGYRYDAEQDIFYSDMNAWQRDVGYCRLYDEAAAPLGMIIDCEPVYFKCGGKKWLIEFWKGQYDLTTGCEIGVYNTKSLDLNIPGVFNGTFYDCASNAELLQISYSLKKNGETLLTREDRHWWLTGFKLGEFSEPSELTMDINITLIDETMRNAFVQGLKNAGYSDDEITIIGNAVSLEFDKTRTPQPITRTKLTDWIIQRKNELLCDKYQDITGTDNNLVDKLKSIEEQAPEMYGKIINIGKTEKLYEMYEKIKNYLN